MIIDFKSKRENKVDESGLNAQEVALKSMVEKIMLLQKDHEPLSSLSADQRIAQQKAGEVLTHIRTQGVEKTDNELLLLLTDELATQGILMAPDPYLVRRIVQPFEDLFFLASSSDAIDLWQNLQSLKEQYFLFEVGIVVANADDHICESERAFFYDKTLQSDLDDKDRARLQLNVLWHLTYPSQMKSIISRLEKLPAQHKEEVARFILSTMISDGWFDLGGEKRTLEKIFSILNMPSSAIYNFLEKYSPSQSHPSQSHKDTQEQQLQNQEASEKTQVDPASDRTVIPMVTLDLDDFSSSKSKAEESAQELLESIFDGAQEEMLQDEVTIGGLSKILAHIITQLMKRQQLSHQEFCAMVRQYQLMEQGVVEEINEWSYEYLDLDDDFLIFDDTQKMYQVHPESIEALQEKEDLRQLIPGFAT
ncbi:MAG: hypothetical protein OXC44_08070 [Proteobacteria bacterium]|nr:hypothetical protein [Pseudomonadota bacterium]